MDYNKFYSENYIQVPLNTPCGEIVIPENRNLYNALKIRFSLLADVAVKNFLETLSNCEDCGEFCDNGYKFFQDSISVALEDIKSAFISIGEYDKDYDTIYEAAVKHELLTPFDNAFDVFLDDAASIIGDYESDVNYREARKENRGRWVGGTIGGSMISAVDTQIELSAMNAASGAVHSLANAAGNYISKQQALSKLAKLFNDDEKRDMLTNGVYQSIMNLMKLIIFYVDGNSHYAIIPSAEIEKAQRLTNNLKCGAISDNMIPNVCIDIINADPYNNEFYQFLFDKYGDDGKLLELSSYFNITSLFKYKDEKAVEYVQSVQGKTEEEALRAKQLLSDYCKKINLEENDELECFSYINNLISDFDLQYRTVDEVEHETREEADFSREELPKIKDFMKTISPLSGDPLLPYERDLIEKKETFKSKFSSGVSKKYLGQIEKYLADFEKSFLSVGVFAESERDEAAKKRALKYAKGINYSTVEEFDSQYEKFCDFIIENLGVTIDDATEAKSYLSKKRNKLVNGSGFDISSIGKGLKGLFGKK